MVGSLTRIAVVVFLAIAASGCARPVKIFDQNGARIKEGVPFAETKPFIVEGQLTRLMGVTGPASRMCNPTQSQQIQIQPTGRTLYAKPGGNFFTSSQFSIGFHPNGQLANIGGMTSSTAQGVASFVATISSIASGQNLTSMPDCDSGFVPTGKRCPLKNDQDQIGPCPSSRS